MDYVFEALGFCLYFLIILMALTFIAGLFA